MTDVVVRAATAADVPAVMALMRGLADFEKLPGPDAAAEGRLVKDLFGSGHSPRAQLYCVGDAEGVAAYALTYFTYSTFRARPSLFLEDLFVHPRARGRGIAKAVLAHLRAIAEATGCGRFEWNVLAWNSAAIGLYASVGARILGDWRLCRVDLP